MPKDVSPGEQEQWVALNAGHYGDFAPELAQVWRWFIHVIDETERNHKVARTRFDISIQDRKRGS